MGIYFQPDMSKAKELSTATAHAVLFPAIQGEDAFAELSANMPMDFLCSIKELHPAGPFLKNTHHI